MTRHLLLAGGGHTHALALEAWARQPLPADVQVTLVSPEPLAAYSGMVPGWLAGFYRFEEAAIDLPRLCSLRGARWLRGEVTALRPEARELQLASGESLRYDLLSLNVGSTLTAPAPSSGAILPVRPLSRLRATWPLWRGRFASVPDRPLRVAAVGGGAAGFEALLGALAALRADAPQRVIEAQLVTRSPTLLPGIAVGARRAASRALARAGVTLVAGCDDAAAAVSGQDLVLWATGAEAHLWQRNATRRGGLAVDDNGFVMIADTLQSTSHDSVFACGDCAGWPGGLPKAGVFAVRQAPVLAHNLRASLRNEPLQPYVPQRQFLMLLATGDGRAIAARGPFAAQGAWAWRWKDRIDRRFMSQFPQPETVSP